VRTITARELKDRTGDVVRAVRRGETLLLSFRGKPIATIAPYEPHNAAAPPIRSFEAAWADIERTLLASQPHFPSWREAEDSSRGRG
jgi:prevent-host-death family protein